MTLDTLPQDEPWMTQGERQLNRDLTRALVDYLTTHGAPDTPFVALRLNEVTTTWLLARRLESVLTPTETEPAPCPTPAQAGAIDKCRERLRKAMKEFEACVDNTAPQRPQGLADRMYPVIQKIRSANLHGEGTTGTENTIQPADEQTTDELTRPKPDNPAPPANAPGDGRHRDCTDQTPPRPTRPEVSATPRGLSRTATPDSARTRNPWPVDGDPVPRSQGP